MHRYKFNILYLDTLIIKLGFTLFNIYSLISELYKLHMNVFKYKLLHLYVCMLEFFVVNHIS